MKDLFNATRWIKQIIHKLFGLFGLRISWISTASTDQPTGTDQPTTIDQPRGASRYFGTGKLSPLEENSVELYEKFYGDHLALEEYYNEYRLAFYAEVSRFIRSHGLNLDGKDLIDVGCGTGHLLTELTRWAAPRSLTGCDFSEASVAFSRARYPNCSFFVHDIYQSVPHDFDVVLCTEVIEHLERPYIAVNNLLNATRRGGYLIITVPDGRKDSSPQHVNFWSPESWKIFIKRECDTDNVVFGLVAVDGFSNRFNIAVIPR